VGLGDGRVREIWSGSGLLGRGLMDDLKGFKVIDFKLVRWQVVLGLVGKHCACWLVNGK